MWVRAVKLTSFAPSTKTKGGEATFTYDVAFNGRNGAATVQNDSTSFSASTLDWFAQMAETGNGDYTGPLHPENAQGLTMPFLEITSNLEGTTMKFSPYLNYTANDRQRYSSGFDLLEKRMGKIPMTQAYELANSIGKITDWNVGDPRATHPESGDSLAKCMTTKLKNTK